MAEEIKVTTKDKKKRWKWVRDWLSIIIGREKS